MRNILVVGIFITCLLFPVVSGGQQLDEDLAPGYNVIDPIQIYNYCKILASERFAGRYTGHEGYTGAAEWAAKYFHKWNLEQVSKENGNGHLQPYPSPYSMIDEARMALFIDGKELPLEPLKDFIPLLFSDSGSNRAPLVFAGWGISAPELGYDDYAGLDVKGKFVLCFRGTPDRSDKKFDHHDHHRHRMQTAQQKGSLGIIYIYPEPVSNPNGDRLEGFTPGMIGYHVADKLLKEKGMTAKELREELLKTKKPRSFALTSQMDFQVKARYFPDGTGYNVVGYIEGSDPKLKKECLVLGAHFDHNGLHMGILFPGANDNASGSAVVMELAHAFSKLKKKPKRSVVFVLFGGEEMGLMGSTYFAYHLPPLFMKVDSMFNFDMVGEGDGTGCGLSPEPKELEETLKQADSYVNTLRRTWYIKGVGVRSSDYKPFYLQGAKCISFYSNGPHLHYHKPGDTIYRINPDIMADVARLAFITAYKWADR